MTWFPTLPPGSLQGMAPETEDVHAAYAQLRERGVIVAHEVKEEFWGTLSTFSDPDGHGFILSQRQAT